MVNECGGVCIYVNAVNASNLDLIVTALFMLLPWAVGFAMVTMKLSDVLFDNIGRWVKKW